MSKLLASNSMTWLTEGGMVEAIRRDQAIHLHPDLVHALLIYEETGRNALTKLWNAYLGTALKHDHPILCYTAWAHEVISNKKVFHYY